MKIKIQSLLSWTYKPKLGQNHAKMNQKRSFFSVTRFKNMIKQTLWFIASLFLEGYSFATHYLIFRLLHITMLEKNGKACNKKKSVLTQNLNVAWHYCFYPNHSGIIFQSTKKYFNRSQNIYYLIISVHSYAPALLFPFALYPRLHAGSTCLQMALPSIWTYVQYL